MPSPASAFAPRRSTRMAACGLALLAATRVQAAAPTDVSTLLRHQTQAFSDAGQRGDADVLRALLDDRVIFSNENGEVSSKDDIVAGASPPPPGTSVTMTVTDWSCVLHGDVAVASFIDDQVRDLHGQVFHAQYRSVETWLREGSAWLMIGSQTLALQTDPPAIALDAPTLDQYVGAYRAGADLSATVARSGADLTIAANGGAPSPQKAELRDVFFTPGAPRVRRIFRRDAHGTVTGFISRREGHDIVFTRTRSG